MTQQQALLLLRLIDTLAFLLREAPQVKRDYDALSAKVRTFVEEDRDPTPAETAELGDRLRNLSAELQARALELGQ